MIRFFEDLRFVIGLFFAIISVILIALGLLRPDTGIHGFNLNLISGLTMGFFAVSMLSLAIWSKSEVADVAEVEVTEVAIEQTKVESKSMLI
jgi:uncharacterized membrane protein